MKYFLAALAFIGVCLMTLVVGLCFGFKFGTEECGVTALVGFIAASFCAYAVIHWDA